MKKTLYKGAYRVVSALSDLTGGASPVAKWKVALGVAIMALTVGVTTGCEPHTTCYDPVEPMCYDPVVPPEEADPGQGRETGTEDDPGMMCYAPALPPEDQP